MISDISVPYRQVLCERFWLMCVAGVYTTRYIFFAINILYFKTNVYFCNNFVIDCTITQIGKRCFIKVPALLQCLHFGIGILL